MAKRYTDEDLAHLDAQFLELIEEKSWAFLVAEPSVPFRKTLVMALKKAGCETVLEAKDGIDAVLQAQQCPIGVVAIVELNMPAADGLEFIRQFRAEPKFATAPVLFMSAETKKERIIAAVKSGATAYFKKPFEPQVLIDKLKALKVV